MKSIGLFAGIGGIELGFQKHGVENTLLCEIMPEAQAILRFQFPGTALTADVRNIESLPDADILFAGFPCQNISIAGDKTGMRGKQSSLVTEIFRLLRTNRPNYVIIENVANIISLHSGEILQYIVSELNALGYNWAYRLIDPRSLGIPQRRPRFVLVASLIASPKHILFPAEEDITIAIEEKPDAHSLSKDSVSAYGFYWTEGKIGIGWANNSIPPLKCGSTLGLASAPAVWDIRNNLFGCPTINDAERLQGFTADWTKAIENEGYKTYFRWKVVGNAVNVAVSRWLADRLDVDCNKVTFPTHRCRQKTMRKWPKSAFQDIGSPIYSIESSPYPQGVNYTPILDFLNEPLKPLSLKATLGFLKRVKESTLIKYPPQFIHSIETYLKQQYGYNV